jgi:hypothetical protein
MPQLNKQAQRLYDSLKENIGEKDANAFLAVLPLSQSADFKRKFKWAADVCSYLENTYTAEVIKKIRMGCSCSPSDNELIKAKQMFSEASDMNSFVANYNKAFAASRIIWHENGKLYFSYPTCYCSCVKRVSETLSKTWCLCTLGYTKKLFDYVFDTDTKVELIESIKLGNSRCVMAIKY